MLIRANRSLRISEHHHTGGLNLPPLGVSHVRAVAQMRQQGRQFLAQRALVAL